MIYEFHNQFDVTLSEEYRMAASPGFGLLAYAAIAIVTIRAGLDAKDVWYPVSLIAVILFISI